MSENKVNGTSMTRRRPEAPKGMPRGGPGRGPGGRASMKDSIKQLDFKVLGRVLGFISGIDRVMFLGVLLCQIINAVVMVKVSTFVGEMIDNHITPMLAAGSTDFAPLLTDILKLGVVMLVGLIATFASGQMLALVTQSAQKKLRDTMFSHMQTLPIKYFDTHAFGDVMSTYTNDTDTLRQLISGTIPNVFSSLFTIVSVFITMVSLSIPMRAFVLLTGFLMMTFTGRIAGNSMKYFMGQQTALADVNGYVEEMLNGQKVVKVFCHEQTAKEDFDYLNDVWFKNSCTANKVANILGPVMNNLGHIQYVLLAMVGGALAIFGVGGLTLGGVASFLTLSRSFTNPINQMAQQLNAVAMAMAGAKRIFALIDAEPEVDEGYVTLVNARENADGTLEETSERTGVWAWKHPHKDGTLTYTKLQGHITMHDVDFGYVPEKTVLHDITLYAEPGQKVAFVGATGAGKTTITNLINRFYDIVDGKIRYDGINITKIKKADLRRSLGVVLQDVNLFTGTVMENIRYGNLDATDEECIAAAKLANAHDFISRLPEGYNTELTNNGGNLSQGQRQLISIARAAVADPPVMILDEATSSIDTRTEALVQRGMDALMYGRTVFVIAHRLSTVHNSDCIMVLDHGVIIERGTHEQLIKQQGQYYRLYTGAFELE